MLPGVKKKGASGSGHREGKGSKVRLDVFFPGGSISVAGDWPVSGERTDEMS